MGIIILMVVIVAVCLAAPFIGSDSRPVAGDRPDPSVWW
jgi:hypothetical protein